MPVQLIIIVQYLNKLFSLKNIGLMIFSGFISLLSIKIIDLDLIIGNSNLQKISIPLIIESICIFLYLIQVTIDLITGIQASRKINQKRKIVRDNPIQSHRLYRTIWKILAVVFLTITICFFTIVCELLNSIAYHMFIWTLIWIWILIFLFEWKSIGENLERIDGKNYPILMFMQKLLNTIEDSGLKRIKQTLEGDTNTYNEEKNNTEEMN